MRSVRRWRYRGSEDRTVHVASDQPGTARGQGEEPMLRARSGEDRQRRTRTCSGPAESPLRAGQSGPVWAAGNRNGRPRGHADAGVATALERSPATVVRDRRNFLRIFEKGPEDCRPECFWPIRHRCRSSRAPALGFRTRRGPSRAGTRRSRFRRATVSARRH